MKNILSFLFFLYGFISLHAQNIPHANAGGPYGIQVNTFNGNLYFQRTDLVIPNTGLGIDLTFHYNSFRDTLDVGYGKGWTSNYSLQYFPDSTSIAVERPDGRRDAYRKNGSAYESPQGIFDQWEEYNSGQFVLTTLYGMKYYFDNPDHRKLTRIEDNNNNFIDLSYEGNQLSQIADVSGRVVNLSWTDERLSTVEDDNFSEARQLTFQYNNNGQLLTATDLEGGIMQYAYTENTLIQILNERGDFLDIAYNENERVTELISCLTTLRFQYNTDNNSTYVVEKNQNGDRVTTYEYDEAGKLLSRTGNCCGFNVQYNYDEDNNVRQLKDANGNNFTANHDSKGNRLLSKNPFDERQSFKFSETLNRLTEFTDKRGNTTTLRYDDQGNLQRVQQPENVTLLFGYDNHGNIQELTDGNGHVTAMSYNDNNDLIRIEYPIDGLTERMEYDKAGNLLESTDANNNTVFYDYDKLNRVTAVRDNLSNEVQFFYDLASNLTTEIDANGNEKEYGYDAKNRLETVITPTGTTLYGYDTSDNLTSILDANQHETRFAYDTHDLLTSERDPLGNETSYTYDGNGNVLTKIDANGEPTAYTYDALNRLINKTYRGNTDNYEYDANGNLTYCSNNQISMRFTYDKLNRLIAKTVENWNLTIAYGYDQAGNRTSMTDATGETRYTYDENNRLTSITNPKNETTSFIYDNGNRLTEQRMANGTQTTYTYDRANRLLNLVNQTANGETISSYEYEYDSNGNRIRMTDHNGKTWLYEYDGDNRLKKVQQNGDPIENYSLDSVGNRLSFNNTSYTYDEADRLQSEGETTYDYDKNGNLITKTVSGETTTYLYDGENRLIQVNTPDGKATQFQYDPFGNRITRSIDGNITRYLLDGENVLLELSTSNTIQARYTAGLALDSWISMDRAGDSYFYHTDGLGSTRNLTNTNETVVNTYEYDSYGTVTNQTGTVENPYTYTGREWEEAIGLYYYRTRFYDAEVGRFLTKDGFDGFIDRPMSINKYNYLENNPINFSDPTGEILPLLGAVVFHGLRHFAVKTLTRNAGKMLTNGLLGAAHQVVVEGKKIECIDYADVLVDAAFGYSPFPGFSSLKSLPNVIFKTGARKQVKSSMRRTIRRTGLKRGGIKNHKEYQELVNAVNKGDRLFFREEVGANIYSTLVKEKLKNEIDFSSNDCSEEESKGEQALPPLPPLPELPPLPDKNDLCIPIIRSFDPNEIIAPTGFGQQRWVAQKDELPYTILFENDPDFATAAAQRVSIEHQFDSDLNKFTFRLGDFGFGNYYFEVPDDVSYYNTQIDLRDSLGIFLQVTAGLDANNGKAFWILESKDPATGLSTTLPAEAGFLPVNDTISRAGEGFVNFTIKPSQSSSTGDTILAKASIVFDENPPILTNTEYNIIDADAPITTVQEVAVMAANGEVTLSWAGTDIGSGMNSYNLYASVNGQAFLPVLADLTDTVYVFNGKADSTYQFFTIGIDNVTNRERLKGSAEPACMTAEIVSQTATNANSSEGSASINVLNNSGAVTYSWSHDSDLNSPIATNLRAGDYIVTITDTTLCRITVALTIDHTTSIIDPSFVEASGLLIHQIAPVPAHSEITVKFSSASKLVYLEVYNVNGQKLIGRTIPTNTSSKHTESIDIRSFAPGSYYVSIRDRSGRVGGIFLKQ